MSPPTEQPPPASGPSPERPRRSKLRLAVRTFVSVLLALAIVIALALVFLHSPAGRAAARVSLESWGSQVTGGTLRLGQLEVALWRGHAAATAVTLELPGTRLAVQRVAVDWPVGTRPQLLLVRPQVIVTDTGGPKRAAPAVGLAARPWLALERFRRVEVTDGRVELRDAKSAPWLVLAGLDAWGTEGSRQLSLRVAAADLGWPEGGLRVKGAALEGAFAVKEGSLEIAQARLTAGRSSLELAGALQRILPLTGNLSGRAALDGALVAAVSPGTEVVGQVEIETAFDARDDRFKGTLTTSSEALTVSGIGPWSAAGRARLEGSELVVESFAIDGYGGHVEASGPVALNTAGRTELELRARGFDPVVVARALSPEASSPTMLPLSAVASATLRVTASGWDFETARGTGQVALQPGTGPGLKPTGAAGVRIQGRTLAIADAHVEARGARVTVDGELRRDRSVSGRWTAEVPLAAVHELMADVGRSVKTPELSGRLRVEGEIKGATSAPEVAARLRSEDLAVHGNPVGLEAEALYQDGRLSVAPLVLRSGRGQATLTGKVPLLPTDEWDLAGEVDSLDVAPALDLAGLEGNGPATGTLAVAGPRDEPRTRVSLRADAHLQRADGAAGDDDVVLQVDGQSVGGRVELERLEAQLAGGRVAGTARYDAASGAVGASLEASGLAWERLPLVPLAARRVAGTLAGKLALAGSTSVPEGELSLTLAEPRLDGAPLPPLALTVRADGRELHVTGTSDTAELLTGSGRLEGEWPLKLVIDAKALPYAALAAAFPAMKEKAADIAGSGRLEVELPLREPARLRYASSDLAFSGHVRKLEWKIAPFTLEGDRESLQVSGLKLEADKAWMTANGKAGLAAASPFALDVEGSLDFQALGPALPVRTFGGQGTLKLHVGGTHESPQLDGALTLVDVRGRIEGARVTDLDLEARFVGRDLRVERLQAAVLGGTLTASGDIPLLEKSGGASRFVVDVKDVDLAQFIDRELRESADSPSLRVSLEGELNAEAPSLARVSAHGRLSRFDSLSLEGALALEAPVAWSLERGALTVEPIRLKGALGALEARLGGTLAGAHPAGEAAFSGAVDLRALSPFLPETTVSGPATIDVRATRAGDAWRLDGAVKVEKARLSLDALNFVASDLAGELRFEGDRALLEASAASSDGRLRASGSLRPGRSLLGVADLELTAERVPINYPAGFRGRASGGLRLSGEPGHYRVTGDVDVRQSFYTAEFNAESQSLDRLDWQLAALDGGSLADQIALDVNVRLAEPVRVRNDAMHVDLEGSLTASGTLAQPTADGVVTMREGGELTVGRAQVRVSSGRIVLNGYPAGTPDLDFQGATSVSGIPFTLRATGGVDDLQLTLESDRADLSQTDLLSLLATGRTAAAAASAGGVVVAEQLAVALGGVLQKGVGDTLVIDVAPDRSLLTEDTDPTQRMHIGTRITQNLTVLYSVALDGTQQRWIVELNPGGGRFRFRAITEEDNTFSVEGTDRFSFDLWNRGRRVGKAPREIDRLASLRFEGSLPLAEPELRKATKLKTRRRYSGLQREQAADRVRNRLAREGYRSASVDAITQPRAGGGVELVLRVEPGPLVTFDWGGDDPGGKTKQAAEQAFTSFASPEAAASQVARITQQRLQADGYYGATVEAKTTSTEGQVAVALHVARGTKGTSVTVDFDGNEAVDDATLLAALPKPGSLEFFEALDPRSARISGAVRLAYARVGYLRARVPPARSRFDTTTGRLDVTIRVRERFPATVAEIELPEELREPGAPPLALQLERGEPFDLGAYVADREALVAWYRAQGWIQAQAGSTIETRGGDVAIHYNVDKGPRPRIGSVSVVDGGNTKSSVIRHSIKLREGDYIKPTALAESRERLSDLGIYRSVDVRTEARTPQGDLRDVVVGLVPKPDVQVEYGLRYTTAGNAGASGTAETTPSSADLQAAIAVELNSPFGYGVKTRGYTFLTTDRQTWGVSLDAATIVGRRLRTQLFVFDDDEDDDFLLAGIDSRVRGVTLQQSRVLLRDRRSRRWHDRLRLQWGYTFKNIEYFGSEPGVVQLQGYRGFLTLAAVGDERDSLTDPTRGVFWTATTELARTWLGSDADYVRLYGQLFGFVPVGPLVWAQGLRVGTVPGENALALIENRFRAGGSTTVRGFDQNDLGPKGPEGGSLGGQAVVVVNEELRFPVYKSLKGGVFWDAGNVWAFQRELSFKDLRQSVGFGLRYMFPFGPIRLEYAWILNRQEGEPKGRFVFGLGHAF